MVEKNTKDDLLCKEKDFAFRDTSYCSFWLYNSQRDINSKHLKDKFVNFYDEKELLSEFNPNVAKNIISFWSEDKDKILDPFAGRTRALIAYSMNRQYVGYEVSKHVSDYIHQRFVELGLDKRDNFNVKINNKDCREIESDYYKKEEFDLIFTCPPYWNLEEYESVPGQLSDINDYDMFVYALAARLNIAVSVLKKGKYMAIVIGDFRKKGKYHTLHCDLIKTMEKNKDIKLHDVIVMQNMPFNTAAYYFGAKRKYKFTSKAHEYLLIWKKNDL